MPRNRIPTEIIIRRRAADRQRLRELLNRRYDAIEDVRYFFENLTPGENLTDEWVVLNAKDDGQQRHGAAEARKTLFGELCQRPKPDVVFIAEARGVCTIRTLLSEYAISPERISDVHVAIKPTSWVDVIEWDITTIPQTTTIEKLRSVPLHNNGEWTIYSKLFSQRTTAMSASKLDAINRFVCIHFYKKMCDVVKIDVLTCFLKMLWQEHTRPQPYHFGSIIVGGDFNFNLYLLANNFLEQNNAFEVSVITDGTEKHITGFVHLYPRDHPRITLTNPEALGFASTFDHPFVFVQASVFANNLG